MTTYPLSSLSATIDETGISAPSYSDIFLSMSALMKQIYGEDIYIEPDSQDGQLIGIVSKAVFDSNMAMVSCFNSFRPAFAQKEGLSSIVKINGISRNSSSYSTVDVEVSGEVDSVILNGMVIDDNNKIWNLPPSVTISVSGSTTVTAVASEPGLISIGIGGITKIGNPQLGWQSVYNNVASTPGASVEDDVDLKARQKISTSLPALTIFESILGQVANVSGVSRYAGYENDTETTYSNGIPAHSMAIVCEGGAMQDIVNAIGLKKTVGSQTFGTHYGMYVNKYGRSNRIYYSVLVLKNIRFSFTIVALKNWVSTTKDKIKAALVNYCNKLEIGSDVYTTQALSAAGLPGTAEGLTFSIQISSFQLSSATYPATPSAPSVNSDITIAFNEAAFCLLSNIDITGP